MSTSFISRALAAQISLSLVLAPVAASAQTPLGCVAGAAGCVLPLTDPAVVPQGGPTQPVAVEPHSSNLWIWLLGAALAAGVIILLATNDNNDNNNPVSP